MISIVPRDDNNNDNDVWGMKTHLPLETPIRSASGRTEAAGMALWQATIFMRAHYDVTLRRNNKEAAAAPPAGRAGCVLPTGPFRTA